MQEGIDDFVDDSREAIEWTKDTAEEMGITKENIVKAIDNGDKLVEKMGKIGEANDDLKKNLKNWADKRRR